MKLLLLSLSVIFLVTACGSNNENRRLAPLTEADLGVLINLHQDEVSTKFSETKPVSRSRILPFTEIMNASVSEVKAAFPSAAVVKNSFVKNESYSKSLSKIPNTDLMRKLNDEENNEEFSFRDCSVSPDTLRPVISIVDESSLPRFLTKEDTLTVTSRKSLFTEPEKDFQFAWVVVPPTGSKIKAELILEQDLEVNFDMAGVYEVNLFVKQGVLCNAETLRIPVTSNEPMVDLDLDQTEALINKQFSNLSFEQINLMGVREAQQRSSMGEGTLVAVLDSGVNYNSPFLNNKIWRNPNEKQDGQDSDGNDQIDDVFGYDFVNDDPFPMDDDGHGSHVAGLIAGSIFGVAQNATIMPVKVLNAFGFADTGTILSGLVYAILNDADIINISIGGGINPGLVDLLLSIYSEAEKRDILIVAAAGNGDPETGRSANIDEKPVYPAALSFDNILTVGSSDIRGNLTYYSNYGVRSVDVLALGGMDFNIETGQPVDEKLLSAYIPNPSGIVLNPMMGTSMAAPVTAGMTAVLRGENSNLTAFEINNILMDSSDKQPHLEGIVKSAGIVNLNSALDMLSTRLIN